MEEDEDDNILLDDLPPSPDVTRQLGSSPSSSETTASSQQPDPEPETSNSPELQRSSKPQEHFDGEVTLRKECGPDSLPLDYSGTPQECNDAEATVLEKSKAASESPPSGNSEILCINFSTAGRGNQPLLNVKNFCGERGTGIMGSETSSGIPVFLQSLDSCAPPKLQTTTASTSEGFDSTKKKALENKGFAEDGNDHRRRGFDGSSDIGRSGNGSHGAGILEKSLLNDRPSNVFTLEERGSSLASDLDLDLDSIHSWNGDDKTIAWRTNPLWVRNTGHHAETQFRTIQAKKPLRGSEVDDSRSDDSLPDYSKAVQQLKKKGRESLNKACKQRSSFNPRKEPAFLAVEDPLNSSADEKAREVMKSLCARIVSLTDAEKVVGVDADVAKSTDGDDDVKRDDEVFEEEEVTGDNEAEPGLRMFLPCSRRRLRHLTRARVVAFLLKYVLFLINFLFWITSVAAITVGAWVVSERGQIVRDSASIFLDPSAMLCLLGALTFVVAFCGCLGALRENICLLQVFQFSMVGVLLLEFLVAMLVFAFYRMPEFRKHLTAGPEEVLINAIRRYHDDDGLKRWVDLLQTEFKCCGARHNETGYLDWQQNPYFNCTPHNPSAQRCGVPVSCCIIERGEYINHMCGFATTNKLRMEVFNRIYTQGCMMGLGRWLSAHEAAVGSFSLAIVVPQIIGITLARLLVLHIRRQRVRWRVLHTEKSIYNRNRVEQES